jgi:TonB family protein
MWRPDSEKLAPSDPSFRATENSADVKQESDFAELAAKFAAHGGGKIPAELSGELALDVVLNEIVEQACAATGATGAAIALARDEEMVCRASSGGTAPELGTRLDMHSGLSGACVRSRQMQRCDDAQADPRVEAEVSRQLGVRSVVVLPLVEDEQLIGIFEIFSARTAAFGEREVRTLELLSERVLKNAQALRGALLSRSFDAPQAAFEYGGEGSGEGTDYDSQAARGQTGTIAAAGAPVPGFDWLTTLMGGIIVAVALLMGAAFSMHMGWLQGNSSRRSPRAEAAPSASTAKPSTEAANGIASANAPGPITAADMHVKPADGEPGLRQNVRIPEGSLRVYENGKEIFRMPRSEAGAIAPQAAKVVELSSEGAEGNLIRRVEPEYPEAALSQHVQGAVLLDVHIGEDGRVQEVKVLRGSPLLAEAAVTAVRQWLFKTRTVDGNPIAMEARITLNFTLPPG